MWEKGRQAIHKRRMLLKGLMYILGLEITSKFILHPVRSGASPETTTYDSLNNEETTLETSSNSSIRPSTEIQKINEQYECKKIKWDLEEINENLRELRGKISLSN